MRSTPLEDLLREALEDPLPSAPSDHLAAEVVTDFLEGRLSTEERQPVEDHLAACAPCREWTSVAAAALEESRATSPKPRRPWAWAAAAVLAMGVALWLAYMQGAAPRLAADPELETWWAAARGGSLAQPDLFPGLEPRDGEVVLRSGGQLHPPRPLAPRWSRVLSPRPDFVFSSSADRHEILIVDADETLVARIPLEITPQEGGAISATFSEDLEPLQVGGVYAWKVGGWQDGEWVASPFVPFQVSSDEEMTLLERRLATAEGDPWREGVVLAAMGLNEEALRAFRRWPAEGGEDELLRRRLMGEVLSRQHFIAGALEEELLRRTASIPGTP